MTGVTRQDPVDLAQWREGGQKTRGGKKGAKAFSKAAIEVEEKKEVIPGWRIKPIAPSYVMEGTENIEDENFLKRHQKPENDEKRRKRWDVQRIREQRHVARLRARYNEEDECNLTQPFTEIRGGNLATFVPNPDLAEEICVQEKLPVSVFGCVLPSFGKQDFFLPWINPK